jgi:hypothetical protein
LRTGITRLFLYQTVWPVPSSLPLAACHLGQKSQTVISIPSPILPLEDRLELRLGPGLAQVVGPQIVQRVEHVGAGQQQLLHGHHHQGRCPDCPPPLPGSPGPSVDPARLAIKAAGSSGKLDAVVERARHLFGGRCGQGCRTGQGDDCAGKKVLGHDGSSFHLNSAIAVPLAENEQRAVSQSHPPPPSLLGLAVLHALSSSLIKCRAGLKNPRSKSV